MSDQDRKTDLATLNLALNTLGMSPTSESIKVAMDILIDHEFPVAEYDDCDELNEKINDFFEPWLKASGELEDEEGNETPFPDEELPQLESAEWRAQFLADLNKIQSLLTKLPYS